MIGKIPLFIIFAAHKDIIPSSFYGNFPLEEHLQYIGEKILDQYDSMTPFPPLPREKRNKAPLYLTQSYPLQEEEIEDKTMTAIGYLTCHILEEEELLALQVLESILMETDASPLKKELLNLGLCRQVQAYLDSEISEVPFVIIAKGCHQESAQAIVEATLRILKEIVKKGISPHLIDNAIHQLEFQRSEISSGGYPFGLLLFLRSALLAQHGGEPVNGLKSHELFKKLRHNKDMVLSYQAN